ncbi:MAG: hypothetical protein HYY52_08185 [Candidatus Melainabacteria bacterium]|nr:hypothetical protein [Candidatus Melainabacteria bacterium]
MNHIHKNSLSSITKDDIIVLLFFFDLSYIVFWNIVENSVLGCFSFSILITLIALFVIVTAHLSDEIEIIKLQEQEEYLRKKIRDEYHKIYSLRRRIELLRKAGCIKSNEAKHIISGSDDLVVNTNNYESVNNVYFNYLKKFSNQHGKKENPKRSPQG